MTPATFTPTIGALGTLDGVSNDLEDLRAGLSSLRGDLVTMANALESDKLDTACEALRTDGETVQGIACQVSTAMDELADATREGEERAKLLDAIEDVARGVLSFEELAQLARDLA